MRGVKAIPLYKVKTNLSRVDLLFTFPVERRGGSEISGWLFAFPEAPPVFRAKSCDCESEILRATSARSCENIVKGLERGQAIATTSSLLWGGGYFAVPASVYGEV